MTEKQLTARVNSMLKDDKETIKNLIRKAILSGCMDIDEATEVYRLPKMLLSAIYREMSRQYTPPHPTRNDKKALDNIYSHL